MENLLFFPCTAMSAVIGNEIRKSQTLASPAHSSV